MSPTTTSQLNPDEVVPEIEGIWGEEKFADLWATSANFSGHNFYGLNVSDLFPLNETDWRNSFVSGSSFASVDLRKSRWIGGGASQTTFLNCDLRQAIFSDTCLYEVEFKYCTIDEFTLENAQLLDVKFTECDGPIRLQKASVCGLVVNTCELEGAKFCDSKLKNTKFDSCLLPLCDFTGSQLRDVCFSRSILDEAKIMTALKRKNVTYNACSISPKQLHSKTIPAKTFPHTSRMAVLFCSNRKQ